MVAYAEMLKVKHEPLYLFSSALQAAMTGIQPENIIVFTDIRFPFEVDELRRLGGAYIHIKTDLPPVNDLERACEPVMAKMTGFVVRNDFDSTYRVQMLEVMQALIHRFQSGSL